MSGKKVFISGVRENQQVADVFLVSRKTLAETKAGKPYLALSLMDKTGEIEARVWDNAARFDAEAETGSFVLVQGTARSFRDQLQLGVVSLQQVEEQSVRLEDFMPASSRSFTLMQQELEQVISGVKDEPLRGLLEEIFQGETLDRFIKAPAAKKMHHAYLGGLLEHTLSVTGMAIKTADHYPELDRDLLIAGTLLHDIAKISEFSFIRLPFDYTDKGRLIGHLVLGAEMVREAAAGVSELKEERLDQLLHLVLSHHGRHEFGAPVLPMTPEALMLHHLDDMDAKMNYIDHLREKMTEPGYQWTEYQRPLERYLYLRGLEQKAEDPGVRPEQTHEPVPRPQPKEKKVQGTRQQSLF